MDKNDILNYVTETPGNTNRAVLGSMLDSIGGGGGADNVFIIGNSIDLQTGIYTLDKTWKEIKDAFDAGKIIFFRGIWSNDPDDFDGGQGILYNIAGTSPDYYIVQFVGDNVTYMTDNINGYPSTEQI